MFSLVYKSVANPVFGLAQIREMLEKARDFNRKNHITGCLLFYEGWFLQYLEGHQPVVVSLFDRIQRDSRHSKLEVLSSEAINQREFVHWDMAFEDLRGYNVQFRYLQLLVSSFKDDPNAELGLKPTSQQFWTATRLMLETKRSFEGNK